MEQNKDKKLYLIMGILLILIFWILRNLIISDKDYIVDYSELPDGKSLAYSGDIIFDRDIYYVLDDIIGKFVTSEASINDEEDSSDDYYKTLNSGYKKRISRNEYNTLVNNFCNRLIVSDSSGFDNNKYLETTNIIRNMYDLGNNTYICTVGLSDTEEYGYIGIKLYPKEYLFEIFYIE